jgi:hypothetical protein
LKLNNIILHKKINLTLDDFYKLSYKLDIKLCKNCISFKIGKYNTKIFVNGSIVCTGISCNKEELPKIIKELNETILKIFKILKNSASNEFCLKNLQKIGDLFYVKSLPPSEDKSHLYILNDLSEFVGYYNSKNNELILQNINVQFCKEKNLFIEKTKNKNKIVFKNGKKIGIIKFDLYNSKYFYDNNHIQLDYENDLIFCKEKQIGKILWDNKVKMPLSIKNHEKGGRRGAQPPTVNEFEFKIISFNVGFKLDNKINRICLHQNLLNKGYLCEFKLLNYNAVNLYIDNFTISIFKSGEILIKGVTQTSKFDFSKIINLIKNNTF